MSWFTAWLGYGFGRQVAKTAFGEDRRPDAAKPPIRAQTEEEIRADERRYDEEARRLDAEDRAAKRRGG